MSKDVDVDCTTGVVARENCRKLGNALGISVLKSTQHCIVSIRWVFGPNTVSVCYYSSIHTGCIAIFAVVLGLAFYWRGRKLTPYLHQSVIDRLTCCHVNDLSVKDKFNALLPISDIRSDILSANIYNGVRQAVLKEGKSYSMVLQ
jgi:hypothetical protein